jgi:type IX secretion system PorP/SprF family membrane protein
MFDRMSFNPATTGFKGYCGTLIYRNQWDRVQDAPNTTLFNAQGNLQKYNVGVGLSFTNDAIGFTRNNTLTINGAYHYPTPFGTLSGGIGIGIINVGFSPKWIPPTTDFDANIPLVPISGTGFDVNLGFFWQADNYYAGISTTHLAPADLDKVSYSVARHYYVYGGYNLKLSDITGWSRRVDLKPSTLIKADGSTMVFDLNVTSDVWMNSYSYFWGGVSYRYIDAVALMVGYGFSPKANTNLDMFKFGYSFDIMTNKLNTYGKGTHELMVNYCMFPPAPTVARHGNPFILQ